jgi:hypothetical protein
MTTADGMQPVAVPVGPCRCIGGADTLHPDGDVVYLAPEVSLTLGLAANGALTVSQGDPAQMETMLGRLFIEKGIVSWTFTEDDEPVDVTPANIERWLPWGKGGSLVSERANDLYSADILHPLVRRLSNARQPGPTGVLTSVTRPSRRQRRNSSKSSSPAPSEMPA